MLIGRSCALGLLLRWLLVLGSAAGCAPKASTTPLGMGPLAQAEQAAASQKKKPSSSGGRRAARTVSAPQPDTPAAPTVSETSAEDLEVGSGDTPAANAPEPSSGKKPPPAFAGLFAGKDVATFRIAGMPERQELDDKAQIRIESESPTQLRVVLINSENGSDLCDLSAEVHGSSAQIDGGQPCFSSEGEGAIQAELTSGTVTLSGDRLSMVAEGTLSVALAEEELDGDLSYSFKGKRQ